LEPLQPLQCHGMAVAAARGPAQAPPATWGPSPATSQPTTPWKKQPGSPETSSTDVPPTLTRGARRRLQQRLRKKLGRLERARAAAGLPVLEKEEGEEPAQVTEEVHELPIVVIDQVAEKMPFQMPVMDLSVEGPCAGKLVPICAVQKDERLHESSELDVMDAFIALPWQRKASQKRPEPLQMEEEPLLLRPEPERPATEACEVQSDSAESVPSVHSWASDGRLARRSHQEVSWPMQPGAQIPTANTFVHFPEPRECCTRRRSLSV